MHRRITVGNSRANGIAERAIRTLKDVMRRSMTTQEDSHWSDHVPAALMMLRFTATPTIKFPPFTVITGRTPVPPAYLSDTAVPVDSEKQSEDYISWVLKRIQLLSPGVLIPQQ